MKIALIGYGKMGKTIEALGLKQGHSFPLCIDINNARDLNPENIKGLDVAIEFSAPFSAADNVKSCLKLGLPVVCGTTGWNDRMEEVKEFCLETKGTFFYASNFSIGVNILFAMNRHLAKIMDKFPQYQVSMEEVHHVHKLDAPSGTGISLAEGIIAERKASTGWTLENNQDPAQIFINAIRKGEVNGIHSVSYTSPLDTISLSHDAKSREAFAAGVLLAASFIKDQKGIFDMSDMLDI